MSIAAGEGILKFYFYRTEPTFLGTGGVQNTPFAQVVMPTLGFAQMAVFFQHQLDTLVAQDRLKKELVDQYRASLKAVDAQKSA